MKKTLLSLTSAILALTLGFLSCGGGKKTGTDPTPPSVAVTGLTLSRNSMTLAVGDATGILAHSVYPQNATNKGITWSSSNAAVAAVSQSGVVTPVSVGTATVTATSQSGGKTAECSIEVVAGPIPAVGAYLNRNELAITEGGSGALALNFIPAKATNQNVTWQSSNTAVATVDANGVITAKAEGEAEITATYQQQVATAIYDYGNDVRATAPATQKATLTVGAKSHTVHATGVEMDQKTLELSIGGSGLLFPTVLPHNATNVNLSFSSSDPRIAAVSSLGLVTGRAVGAAIITAATEDGGHKATCAVAVIGSVLQPSGVSLNKSAIELGDIGETDRLMATVNPYNATDKSLYWYSSDPLVAAVNANGTVQARGKGVAVVTAETQVGGLKATCAVTVAIRAAGVRLNKTQLALGVGEAEALTAEVIPSQAANQRVSWSTNNPAVATVSDGLVTGVAAGAATITVTTQDGNKTATCAVTVANIAVSSMSLNRQTMSLPIGSQEQLTHTILPANATNKSVSWSTSDASIATVSNGTVRGVAAGSATIIVTTSDGGKTATCAVTVNTVSVTGVSLNKTTANITVGGTETLTATVAPSNATNKSITWSTSNASIATVSNGLVTGVSAGTANITVTTLDGNKTASCVVTVTGAEPPYITGNSTIATGYGHTLAIMADGSLWAWGYNARGLLGLGDDIERNTPVQVGSAKDWAAVSTSSAHTMAIKSDGSLWACGRNAAGELGLGTTNQNVHGTPTQVGSDKNWMAVAAGDAYTMALKSDGSLWAWGVNNHGQLGLGDTTTRYSPVQVGSAKDWAAVSVGTYIVPSDIPGWGYSGCYTLAIKSDGSLWAWGGNALGQLGLGDNTDRNAPVQVGSTKDWAAVSAGGGHNMALKKDGSLWAWGWNGNGQLGFGDTKDRNIPVQVGSAKDWAVMAASRDVNGGHTMAIKTDGSLWAWGSNGFGRLGLGDNTDRNTPVQVGAAKDWAAVSAGDYHTVAIKSNGNLWAWGWNQYGQLGYIATYYVPAQVGLDRDWASVSAGDNHTVDIKSNGSLWGWGDNNLYAIGGTARVQYVPAQVGSSKDWAAVSASYLNTTAIKSDGSLWAWGWNQYGQLGLGDTTDRNTPTQLGTGTDWAAVSAGHEHRMAIKKDGSLWAWGRNGNGQLGLGDHASRDTPVQVGLSKDWTVIAVGGNNVDEHTMAIKSDGSLWAWGSNKYGQLGFGDQNNRNLPTRVGAANDWAAVAASEASTMAIKKDGSLWAWGWNGNGQLGLGDHNNRNAPTRVGAANDWATVSAGIKHTMAIKSDGSLWSWGFNGNGQLGLGDTTDRNAPVRVGSARDWAAVLASRGGWTFAIKKDGSLWAWGYNWGCLGLGDIFPVGTGFRVPSK